MNGNYYFKIFFIFFFSAGTCVAQQNINYDLSTALKQHKLLFDAKQSVTLIEDHPMHGVSANGIVWLGDTEFSTGTIDIDLRGKDIFQQSFLGIAIGPDTTTYEAVYFRPFNFQSTDEIRRNHTVQYISHPDYPWEKLRDEFPLVYEHATKPFPLAKDWFHAKIVIDKDEISVYVNHSSAISLHVKRLNKIQKGMLGLWTYGLKGDFVNLKITNTE
ncbi:hypothetical protein HDE68_003635 [Pedobacter cryoconitis]|uniref:3-keto-disaccharide hydrolase domain-containing protein n=1 Tax=Pedobacter cryoconitis TaxID=188932 RepID=A0A7W8ZPN0_9SPHI|nr:hypothetical protein [Pedobacter cryoconitis]MBB5637710.1 hypothetical protein [Pedobacter cryoconitis]